MKSNFDANARLLSFVSQFCENLGTPRALTVLILLRNKEYAQLVNLKCDPRNYDTPYRFLIDYQATRLLCKYSGFRHPELRPIEVAKAAFFGAEEQCRSTNGIWNSPYSEEFQLHPMWTNVQKMKIFIELVLGELDLSKIDGISFGPGGTIGVPRKDACPFMKMKDEVSCGAELFGILSGANPFRDGQLTQAHHNELILVPKNAKTHRSICKEPTLDTSFQRYFGQQIRKKLKVFGCDLNSQLRNQRLAAYGARTDQVATLDLKAASDTMAIAVVRNLLPCRWFLALDSVRSPATRVDGKQIIYEKFSSMGNGYTFELESLIFWAAVNTVVPKSLLKYASVYGDDIIVPSQCSEEITDLLRHLGFSLNEEKSFVSGSFRESCGNDCFKNTIVTPFYIKEPIKNEKDILKVCNQLYTWHYDRIGVPVTDSTTFAPLYARVRGWLSEHVRNLYVPRSFGDTGLITVHRPCPSGNHLRWNSEIQSHEVRHLCFTPIPRKWDGVAAYAFLGHKLLEVGSVISDDYSSSTRSPFAGRWDFYDSFGQPRVREPITGNSYLTADPRIRRNFVYSPIGCWV